MKHTASFAPVIAAALLASLAGGCDRLQAPEPVNAEQALAQNRWGDAARALAPQTEADPANADLARKRVDVLLLLGDGEAAAAAIERLAQANPQAAQGAEWQLRAAEADIWRGQTRAALRRLAGASGPDAARLRALALGINGNYDEAEAELVAALEQTPGHARLNADLAWRKIADQDLEAAQARVARALESAPQSLDARFAQASLIEARGDTAGAAKRLRALAADYPDSHPVKLALARVAVASGQMKEAAQIAATLREAGYGVPALTVIEARIAAHDGRWKDVRAAMQASERELRNVPEAQVLYAVALQKLDQTATAQVILERMVARYPDYIPARAQLIELLLEQGQDDQARTVAEPLRELDSPAGPVKALLARVDAA